MRKGIPVAGGLGGGSSDAAAALAGLARLWAGREEPEELEPLAAELGADVPFFLVGGVAWGVGRGSEVTPLPDLPPWWLVLVPGPEPIPTAEVYRALDASVLDGDAGSEIYRWVIEGGELPLGSCRNDLQPTVVKRWPEVGPAPGACARHAAAACDALGKRWDGVRALPGRGAGTASRRGARRPFVPWSCPCSPGQASLLRPSAMEE